MLTELETEDTPFLRARVFMGETAMRRGHKSLHTRGCQYNKAFPPSAIIARQRMLRRSHDCGSAPLRMEGAVQSRVSGCCGKLGMWNTTHGLASQSKARVLNTAWEDLDDDASNRGVHARELGVDADVGVVHVNLSHRIV